MVVMINPDQRASNTYLQFVSFGLVDSVLRMSCSLFRQNMSIFYTVAVNTAYDANFDVTALLNSNSL